MACNSTGQLGALSAESYCERVLSCANNVVITGNTLLSDEEVEMLVVLRMNRAVHGVHAGELRGGGEANIRADCRA